MNSSGWASEDAIHLVPRNKHNDWGAESFTHSSIPYMFRVSSGRQHAPAVERRHSHEPARVLLAFRNTPAHEPTSKPILLDYRFSGHERQDKRNKKAACTVAGGNSLSPCQGCLSCRIAIPAGRIEERRSRMGPFSIHLWRRRMLRALDLSRR